LRKGGKILTISEIKKGAKIKLSSSYLRCTFCALLYFIVTMVLTFLENLCYKSIDNSVVNAIIEALFLIIKIILGYGLLANIIRIVDIKTNAITDFLNLAIKNTTKYLRTILYALWYTLIPLILFILASFYLLGNLVAKQNNIKFLCFSPQLLVVAIIAFVITLIVLLYFALRYALISYIYYGNLELSPKEITKKSNELMKGKKLKYILLNLSFINWLLVIAIILLILSQFIETMYLTPCVILFYCLLKPYIILSRQGFYESLGE
jgi:uncharacterized membrane protein